jgi:S-adenosyl-L-methionine hydrolase (adenosine-forming)
MAVITLTTDWRNSDYYVGAVKGKIVSLDSSVCIIDINHQIATYNIMQAAFVLQNCYKEFPKGTVHIMGVNSILSPRKALLIIEHDQQFFLCSDNGLPDLLFPLEKKQVYKYSINEEAIDTFSSIQIFAEVAINLIKGKKVTEIAAICKENEYLQQVVLLPTIDANLINGSVIYIDSFSNAITNINRDIFERVGKGSSFNIFVQSNHNIIKKISKTYSDVPTGELLALFNSADLLEIALSHGPVSELLDLRVSSAIRVKFSPGKKENQLHLSGE